MAIEAWQHRFRNRRGEAIPFCSVRFENQATGELVQLYSDTSGTSLAGNPQTTDDQGFLRVYLETGIRYRITATKTIENLQRWYVARPFAHHEVFENVIVSPQTLAGGPARFTGSFTTGSLSSSGGSDNRDIVHGLGTDNVIVEVMAKGNAAGFGSQNESWWCAVHRPDGVCRVFLGPNLTQLPAHDETGTPNSGRIRFHTVNRHSGSQTITVHYEIRIL